MIFTRNKVNIHFDKMKFNDFVIFLKKIKYNINYENVEMINKIKLFYEEYKNNNDKIKKPLISTLNNFLNIKFNSDENRGFELENQMYTFFNVEYFSEEKPKCNICGSELILRKQKNGVYKILKCSNKDCISKQNKYKQKAFLNEDALMELKRKERHRNILCIEYYIDKGYSEEEGFKIISELQSKRGKMVINSNFRCNKEYMINKYGEEYASDFFKKRSMFCIDYWLSRGYSEEEGKKEISKLQSKYGLCLSKKIKEEPHKYKVNNYRCIDYWLSRGYSEEEGKKEISKLQVTFSKEKCIEKYGLDEGLKIWKDRQDKWQKTLHNNGNLKLGYSKISQELFDKILSCCDTPEYIFYATKNKEYSINQDNKNYVFDFCDLNQRKIIEFNGDIYHANPIFFEENDKPNPYCDNTSKYIWDRDNNKIKIANEHNFDVLVIWECDYRNDKNKELKKCLDFLNYEKKHI